MSIFSELNKEISKNDCNVNGKMMEGAQKKIREIPINKRCLINPFSLKI